VPHLPIGKIQDEVVLEVTAAGESSVQEAQSALEEGGMIHSKLDFRLAIFHESFSAGTYTTGARASFPPGVLESGPN
jgi:hypothetical protein